jgi:hypothetical protein
MIKLTAEIVGALLIVVVGRTIAQRKKAAAALRNA